MTEEGPKAKERESEQNYQNGKEREGKRMRLKMVQK